MATPGTAETRLQNFLHALEQGQLAPVIRAILGCVVILGVALIYLGWNFRGFAAPEAMDQAQIGREIATGHGWSTLMIRPLAIWQLQDNHLALPKKDFPDTFNAPLPPLVDALAIKLAGTKMTFPHGVFIAPAERFIVGISMLLFLAAVAVQYALLVRLFDRRLAVWAAALTLGSNLCWQFTLSGLPQMLMLLLFHLALYALARAVESQVARRAAAAQGLGAEAAGAGGILRWLAAVGALCGLLALCHGLSAWIFLGALIFSTVYFRQRLAAFLVLLIPFAAVYAPWMAHEYHVSGSPFGTAIYATFEGLGPSTATRMRSTEGPLIDGILPSFFRSRIEFGVIEELDHLLSNFGGSLLAVTFFVSLLHAFRRQEVSVFRWAVLTIWAVAVVGMAATGAPSSRSEALAPDQLAVLFLPVMLGYGLAFVLVLVGRRLDGGMRPLTRFVVFAGLFLISALPLICTLIPHNSPAFQYPPYYEPAIHKLEAWTTDDEIIGSDMPWAVAWYADRKSLWIPDKFRDFMGLSDEGQLNGPLAGLFLTPISRNAPFLSSLYRGEYQEYEALIFGRSDLPLFPFHEQVAVLGDLSYTFSASSRRWEHPPFAEH
jgi:hypothetical protein